MRIGFNSLFSTEFFETSIKNLNQQFDASLNLVEADFLDLDKGNIDAMAFPIHLLTKNNQTDYKVLTLIDLEKRNYALLIHKDSVNPNHRLGFNQSMEILHPYEFLADGLLSLGENLQLVQSKSTEILTYLKERKAGSYIIESCFLDKTINDTYQVIDLNEKEFGHAPGQGFMAIVAQKKSTYGNLLKRMNQPENIAISNIERKCASLLEDRFNVHCEKGKDNNYHLWVFTKEGSTHLSQSTRNKIEERIIQQLQTV